MLPLWRDGKLTKQETSHSGDYKSICKTNHAADLFSTTSYMGLTNFQENSQELQRPVRKSRSFYNCGSGADCGPWSNTVWRRAPSQHLRSANSERRFLPEAHRGRLFVFFRLSLSAVMADSVSSGCLCQFCGLGGWEVDLTKPAD